MEGFWEFPGGKIESGETPEECLERELAEEFGIESSVGEFVAESVFKYPGKTIRLLGYRTRYLAGDFVLNAHSQIEWVDLEEMEGLEFAPADLPLIEALRKKE